MDDAVWRALAPGSPGLRERWEEWNRAGTRLGALDRLRATHGAPVARFVSLQAELARRARGRLEVDRLPFLTSKGAEQATAAAVARHRAERFAAAGEDRVAWDACCGVGSDLLALADRLGRVVATDIDAATLRCAAANLAHCHGPAGNRWLVARADAAALPTALPEGAPTGEGLLGLFDPDRRPAGAREGRLDRWSPSLERVFEVAAELGGACVKLPPSMSQEDLARPAGDLPLALSWISLDGDMRELSAWSGALAPGGPGREAVALRSDGTASRYTGGTRPLARSAESPQPGQWLVELDRALWRADLAGAFAHDLDAAALDAPGPGGFLVANAPVDHPMARSWRVTAVAPGDRKRVRRMLREHDVGEVTVKTRFHPEPAEQLVRSFRGGGARRGSLAVTRIAGRTVAMLLQD